MAFRHILLGTLMDLPTHAYDMIKKCFADFTPANLKMNEGRLYSTLKTLDKEGLVERSVRPQQDVPDQKIISITPAGSQEFYRWLQSGQEEQGHAKFDFFNQWPFLTKVNFFKFLESEDVREKLVEQLQISALRLERFHQAHQEMTERQVDAYRIRILEYGIEVERIRTAWLQEMLDEQQSGQLG